MNHTRRMLTPVFAKPVLARALACGLLLVLSGCGTPHFRQAQQGPPLPANYSGVATQDNSAKLGIDEFFQDPVLTDLIRQALANNRELKILNEDIAIAKAEILSRRGAYLPFAFFGANARLDRYSRYTLPGAGVHDDPYVDDKFLPNPLPDYKLGLNVIWQLDIWRELRNARDAAALRYLAACERRNYFVTRLVADVAENYYRLMALDQRLLMLDRTIAVQQDSLRIARARMEAARGNELPVRRFEAEVRKNQSEKLIVRQDIIETENRINFLANRYPQPIKRDSSAFFDLLIHTLSVGLPAQLLQNRPDVRQAERELEAAGFDVKVARAHFFPRLDLSAGVGYEAFNPKYLFYTPDAMIANVAADLTAPLVNKRAIQADFIRANARQLQAVYNYQRVLLDAFTQVVNRMTRVVNFTRSIEIKRQQLEALVTSVDVAKKLFYAARIEYIDVLFATRDQLDARMVLIETKREQLAAIVNTYQALGGGCDHGPALLADIDFKALGQDTDKAADTDKAPDKDKPEDKPDLPAPRALDIPQALPAPRPVEVPPPVAGP